MSDIMSFIRNEEARKTDPDGHLLDLDPWDRQIAERLAKEENISLTDDHWQVIELLREDYRDNGEERHARPLLDMLAGAFDAKGGRRYLYQLFPGGPIHQGCKLAGIPVPADSSDASFGSVR